MPPTQALPASVAPLTRLQAVNIRFDPDFSADVRRLIAAIERVDTTARGTTARPGVSPAGSAQRSKTRGRGWLVGSLLVALTVLLMALAIMQGVLQFPPIGAVSHTPTVTAAATATATATPIVGSIYLNALAVPTSGWTVDEHCHFLSDGYHDDDTSGAANTA